jgi:hypothetical protein
VSAAKVLAEQTPQVEPQDEWRRVVTSLLTQLTEVMRERGYPIDDFDAKSRSVSVDHPDAVENYRKGRLIFIKTVEGRATTEDLRQAVLCYRDLFDDLVWEGSEADAEA